MGAQPHSDVPSLGFDVGESDWPGIFPRFKRDVANILKPLALRAQESSECLGGHSKFNTEILASNTAKQTYGAKYPQGRSCRMTKYFECALLPVHVVISSVLCALMV